jgi:hypothetical protein
LRWHPPAASHATCSWWKNTHEFCVSDEDILM